MRPSASSLPLLCAALAAWPCAGRPATVEAGPVTFQTEVEAAGTPLRLRGAGVFRWRWIVKVYAAALYASPEGGRLDPSADAPRRLEFSYLVPIERSGFARAADELLARNVQAEALAPLRARIERLHAAYVDVRAGDRYALTYLPGRGTELALNGRPLALIEGADFARAYFAIWLGPEPIDVGLRDALLGP
jgi:hypothetical protein